MRWFVVVAGLVCAENCGAQEGGRLAPLDPANRGGLGGFATQGRPAIASIPEEISGRNRGIVSDVDPTGLRPVQTPVQPIKANAVRVANLAFQSVNISWWDVATKQWNVVGIDAFVSKDIECPACKDEMRIAFHDGEKSMQYLVRFGVTLPVSQLRGARLLKLGSSDVTALRVAPDQ